MKEILRDPVLSLLGIGLPVLFIILFTELGRSAPIDVFEIQNLVPGIIMFSFSFLMMFSAILLAKDKKTAFIDRLLASPLTSTDYIISYTLPLMPIALLQSTVCFLIGILFGLEISINIILSFLVLLPIALLFIFLGLLLGTLFNENQIAGIGSMIITLSVLFSGVWMDLTLIGGAFKTIGYALPFAHAVDAGRNALNGNYGNILNNEYWVIGYTALLFIISVTTFQRKMKAK